MPVKITMTRTRTPGGKRVDNAMMALPRAHVVAGFPQGDPKAMRDNGEMSNAALAAIHNAVETQYGSPGHNVPPRPFMDGAMKDKTALRELRIMQIGGLRRVMRGTADLKQTMGKIGERMVDAIKDSIRDGNWKANAPSTIARKGSSRPLIDTAQMINSVSHKVVLK